MNLPLIPEPSGAASGALPAAATAIPASPDRTSRPGVRSLSSETRAAWRSVRAILRWIAAGVLALLVILWLAGCAGFPVTARLVTPYGTVTRTAGGKTIIEVHAERLNDTWGFAK